jgi:hypothetical protein
MSRFSQFKPDRRFVLTALAGGAALTLFEAPAVRRALAAAVASPDAVKKAGDYFWDPSRAADGPVMIIVSLPNQTVSVYRDGTLIALSTCSTGKPGHATPTGVFTILEKAKTHFSSTYNNAPMPNMERITWSGVALHAGNLPGYPASHGCIRLPLDFSALLYTVTHKGGVVIVAGSHVDPSLVQNKGIVLGDYSGTDFGAALAALEGKALPHADHGTITTAKVDVQPSPPTPKARPATGEAAAPQPVARPAPPPTPEQQAANAAPHPSVIVSRADMKIIVLDDDKIVAEGKAIIKDPDQPLGTHAFVLDDANADAKTLAWHTISLDGDEGATIDPADSDLIHRISGDTPVIEAMKARMRPGMVLVVTDEPAAAETRTAEGFVLMTTDAGAG